MLSIEGKRHRVPPNFPTRFHPSDIIEFGVDKKVNAIWDFVIYAIILQLNYCTNQKEIVQFHSIEGKRHRVPPNFPTRFHPSDIIEFGVDKKAMFRVNVMYEDTNKCHA
ncbi:Zeaxanthin epoxidase, chloroplastic-like protein [Drosera capensis]